MTPLNKSVKEKERSFEKWQEWRQDVGDIIYQISKSPELMHWAMMHIERDTKRLIKSLSK